MRSDSELSVFIFRCNEWFVVLMYLVVRYCKIVWDKIWFENPMAQDRIVQKPDDSVYRILKWEEHHRFICQLKT